MSGLDQLRVGCGVESPFGRQWCARRDELPVREPQTAEHNPESLGASESDFQDRGYPGYRTRTEMLVAGLPGGLVRVCLGLRNIPETTEGEIVSQA